MAPRGERSRSPRRCEERCEEHPPRGREDGPHRAPSGREHRRARDSAPDRRQRHSRRRRSGERPGSRRARDPDSQPRAARDPDSQPRAGEEERESPAARRRELGTEAQDLVPRPGGHDADRGVPKEKPSLALSGALLEDTNTFRGVLIKYTEPPEARLPKTRWRLYPFKNEQVLPVMYLHRQSAYLLGRHRGIADIPLDHPSCSKQHAVFQYRLVAHTQADGTVGRRVKPYIIDLGSGNGTFINNRRIEPHRYYELEEEDVLKFGFSSREYVLLHESSDDSWS